MSKKLLIGLVALLFAYPLLSQTIVSTTPENKKVILEEFTGINCQFCPVGHVAAKDIRDNNPGNLFIIKYHPTISSFTTPYVAFRPDFRNALGDAIQNQTGLSGYPQGTVNRSVFIGSQTILSVSDWQQAITQTLGESSYVNVAVEAQINAQTRELTVLVEAYYTGNSPATTNKLNVALLQNNTLGPQIVAPNIITPLGLSPTTGEEYNHNNRLIHLLTGQWGVDINTTTQGSFVSETFTYTLPQNHNGQTIEMGDLEIVAFVAESQQKIISGNGTTPTFTGLTLANDIKLRNVTLDGFTEVVNQALDEIEPIVQIQNMGNDTLTSLDIEYTVNSGNIETYTWTGNLDPYQREYIKLPAISYNIQATNTLSVSLEADDDVTNNEVDVTFNQAPETASSLKLRVQTAGQIGPWLHWEIIDVATGAVVEKVNIGTYASNQTYNHFYTLPAGTYKFVVLNHYGFVGGSIFLRDGNDSPIFNASGGYKSKRISYFTTDGTLSTVDNQLQSIALYPNPSTGILNVNTLEVLNVQVFDVTGKLVYSNSTFNPGESLDLSNLQKGLYLVRLAGESGEQTKKIILK